jgi:hypothetical protein
VGASEVTDVVLDGLAGSGPLTIACRVKIPGYAQRTGQRLFLQSALFNRKAPARYSATERRHPVMLENAWAEHDSLSYELPQGYALESPEAPGGLSITGVGEYVTHMSLSADGRTRTTSAADFGRGGNLCSGKRHQASSRFDRLRSSTAASLSSSRRPVEARPPRSACRARPPSRPTTRRPGSARRLPPRRLPSSRACGRWS